MVYRVYVEKKPELANEAKALLNDARNLLGITALQNVRLLNCYDAENITQELFSGCVNTVFSEPQVDNVSYEVPTGDIVFAVEPLPGQYDQRADSAAQCIQIISQGNRPTIRTAKVYVLEGSLTEAEIAAIKKHVINAVESREASLELPETLAAQYAVPETVATVEGFIKLDDKLSVCLKAETHNHPSAIEPYAGANTGLGGVIRDILGAGKGAKPIANLDVFCFGAPDTPQEMVEGHNIIHPLGIMRGVVHGVRDYGNRMGIPTTSGAIQFDPTYIYNPLVFCGTAGVIPQEDIAKEMKPGLAVVVIGGRTGKDGLHGATFSSAAMGEASAEEEIKDGEAASEVAAAEEAPQRKGSPRAGRKRAPSPNSRCPPADPL